MQTITYIMTYQTLVFNDSNISAFIFDDDDEVVLNADNAVCQTQRVIITDMNETNTTIWTDTTPPEDWESGKYLFEVTWSNDTDYESAWSINPNWVEPTEEEE